MVFAMIQDRENVRNKKSVFRHLERVISKHSFSPCDWLKISTNKKEVMPTSLVNFSNAFPRETVIFPPRLRLGKQNLVVSGDQLVIKWFDI